jgi:hypothetical protein
MEAQQQQQQQRAFQEFMMSGGQKAGSQTPTLSCSPSHPTRPSSSSSSSKNNKAIQNIYRKYNAALHAFYASLFRNWLDIDEQLFQSVNAIASLRERMHLSSRALLQQQQQQQQQSHVVDGSGAENPSFWKEHGYRKQQHLSLSRDDLQLTLSDELLQHETMMTVMRRLMSSLAQEQEAMGRRLEEVMNYYAFEVGSVGEDDDDDDDVFGGGRVDKMEECQQLYRATSSELYRKQVMVQEILESMGSDLIVAEDGSHKSAHVNAKASARRIARRCANDWANTCQKSHLFVYMELLKQLDIRKD